MNLIAIITEEIINELVSNSFKFDYNNLSVNDLALIAAELGGYKDKPDMVKVFQEVFLNDFNKGGDDAIMKRFKDVTDLSVHQKRRGRYSFTPQVIPSDYEKKLEE